MTFNFHTANIPAANSMQAPEMERIGISVASASTSASPTARQCRGLVSIPWLLMPLLNKAQCGPWPRSVVVVVAMVVVAVVVEVVVVAVVVMPATCADNNKQSKPHGASPSQPPKV